MASPIIVLTTDFGTTDAYAGVMKGVILHINPAAGIVDLTHQIQPQNIHQAAFILGTSHRFFPAGAIHIVVVDPGVGTERRALLLLTPMAWFLAPDNGVLSAAIQPFGQWTSQKSPLTQRGKEGISSLGESGRVPVPSGCSAYELTNREYWLHPVSETFHGRDIFAPVAAHLSLGIRPESVGTPVSDLVGLSMPEPTRQGSAIRGQVIYVDHFGNLVTNIPAEQLAGAAPKRRGAPGQIQVEIKGQLIRRLSRTYHEVGQQARGQGGRTGSSLLALIGSHGYLEIAVRDGNVALELGVSVGEPVYVVTAP